MSELHPADGLIRVETSLFLDQSAEIMTAINRLFPKGLLPASSTLDLVKDKKKNSKGTIAGPSTPYCDRVSNATCPGTAL